MTDAPLYTRHANSHLPDSLAYIEKGPRKPDGQFPDEFQGLIQEYAAKGAPKTSEDEEAVQVPKSEVLSEEHLEKLDATAQHEIRRCEAKMPLEGGVDTRRYHANGPTGRVTLINNLLE